MSTNKDIMEAAAHLKELLVRDQKYDAAKDVRDIERAYLEKVNTEPVTGERVYTAEQQLINVGNAVKCIEEGHELLEQRVEKLEKALSEHMAEVRENPTFTHLTDPEMTYIGISRKEAYLIYTKEDASPKDIPFSVALEYLKIGREVRRKEWLPSTLRVQPRGHGGVGGMCMVYGASLVQGDFAPASLTDLLATDWLVLPKEEKP